MDPRHDPYLRPHPMAPPPVAGADPRARHAAQRAEHRDWLHRQTKTLAVVAVIGTGAFSALAALHGTGSNTAQANPSRTSQPASQSPAQPPATTTGNGGYGQDDDQGTYGSDSSYGRDEGGPYDDQSASSYDQGSGGSYDQGSQAGDGWGQSEAPQQGGGGVSGGASGGS